MTRRRIQITLLLTLLVSLDVAVQGQQAVHQKRAKAMSYGFVSPNTREDLKLQEAIDNLRSADEVRLVHETQFLACRVRTKARASRSLGNWSDGAEHSLVFRIYADEPTVRYATASLGKNCRQKTVLYFRRQAGGSGRLYVMSIRRQASGLTSVVRALAKTLDESGISYRTLVPLRTRVIVYVVDLTNELQAKVQNAARRLHTRPVLLTGTGGFIGNDTSRDQAQEVFALEIKSYESLHSLSSRCRQTKPIFRKVSNRRASRARRADNQEPCS